MERLYPGAGSVASCSLVLVASLVPPRKSLLTKEEEEEVGLSPLVHIQDLLFRTDESFTLFVPLVFNLLW